MREFVKNMVSMLIFLAVVGLVLFLIFPAYAHGPDREWSHPRSWKERCGLSSSAYNHGARAILRCQYREERKRRHKPSHSPQWHFYWGLPPSRAVWDHPHRTFYEHAPDGHFHVDGSGSWAYGSHRGKRGRHYHN